jgi:hypothetical protein
MKYDALRAAKILVCVMVAGLVGVTAYQVATLPKTLSPSIQVLGSRLDARDRQIGEILQSVKKVADFYSSDAFMYDVYANTETTTVLLHEAQQVVHEVRTKTLPEVDGLLTESTALLHSMQTDLHGLLGEEVPTSVRALNGDLEALAALVQTLDTQVKAGSPEAFKTIAKINKGLDDADALLSDPDVKATLANVNKATGHTASALETVDIVMKPWRERVGMLKLILGKAFGMLKLTIPIPGL